jgi:phage-related protein
MINQSMLQIYAVFFKYPIKQLKKAKNIKKEMDSLSGTHFFGL